MKVLNHYQFVNEKKLQVSQIIKTWVHVLSILFCDQIQFSSIHFEEPSESKSTIYEEDEDENDNIEIVNPSLKIIDEIEINNPILINTNKKRKQGVHENQKERHNIFGSKGVVSFKEIDDSPIEKRNNQRSSAATIDRILTIDTDGKDEAFGSEFLNIWVQSILFNLSEHFQPKKFIKTILKKEGITFFNEDLLNDEEVYCLFNL